MDTQQLIREFFKNKTKQLLAVSDQAIVEHPSLKGTHRENIIDIYLKEILPKRFGVGKGMVYGIAHRSKEADLLIWDEQNYPELRMLGHSLFFAESAKAIIEVKTTWSSDVFKDIKEKSFTSKHMYRNHKPNIIDHLEMMENRFYALAENKTFEGTISSPNHILFSGFVFWGGEQFSIQNLTDDELNEVDDYWPDILIFLNAGKILSKEYIREDEDSMTGNSVLRLYNTGEDTLLIYTSLLLGELMERAVHTEYPFYFTDYIYDLFSRIQYDEIEYPITRPFPGGKKTIWTDNE
jgi:hypothetical protein